MMDANCTICEAEFPNLIKQTFQFGWQGYRYFQIVERGTNRGTPKLLDSMGYTYTVRKREANSTPRLLKAYTHNQLTVKKVYIRQYQN